MSVIKNSQSIILEFYTIGNNNLNFSRNIFLTFNPDVCKIKYATRYNISANNNGVIKIVSNLPLKYSNDLVCLGVGNEFMYINNERQLTGRPNGSYNFQFVPSGNNGVSNIDCDIMLTLEFIEYEK